MSLPVINSPETLTATGVSSSQARQLYDGNPDGMYFGTLHVTSDGSFTDVLTSQIAENNEMALSLTTDSTFLTGSDISYSGGRGSAVLRLTGVWSGATGGFEGIDLKVSSSGALTGATDGVIGVKAVVTNTAQINAGYIYGGQFIAKHNHATNTMLATASLIGLEAISYAAAAGGAKVQIGLNAVCRNYGTPGAGSTHRGIQVVLDQAGGAKATEATGICVWNMAGTWDAVLRVTGAFSRTFSFKDATTCYAVITGAPTTVAGQILVEMPNGNTGYIEVFSTTGT